MLGAKVITGAAQETRGEIRSVLLTIAAAVALHAAFTVSVPLILLHMVDGRARIFAFGLWPWFGIPVVFAGVACYVWALGQLLRRKTSALPGMAPVALETTGLYSHVRNPVLLGVVLILAGEAVNARSLLLAIYAAIYWLALDRLVAVREERDLCVVFGDRYLDYCRNVPRWLPKFWVRSD